MKKYVILPGHVTSRSDGDRHYISATQLINLYRVGHEDCAVVNSRVQAESFIRQGYVLLEPRHDGNYSLPK